VALRRLRINAVQKEVAPPHFISRATSLSTYKSINGVYIYVIEILWRA